MNQAFPLSRVVKHCRFSPYRFALLSLLWSCLLTYGVGAELNLSTWESRDVGAPALAGKSALAGTRLQMEASGAGIGGRVDHFHFSAQPVAGDFDVRARVKAMSATDVWAKAGWMIRSSTSEGARFAGVFTTPTGAGSFFQSRGTDGSASAMQGAFPQNIPFGWLRLSREGTTLRGYAGYDGLHWTELGSVTLDLGADARLGLAFTSHSTRLGSVIFEDIGWAEGAVTRSVDSGMEPLGPTNRRGAVVISEIMYHPADHPSGANLEFIELYNTQPYFEEIGGWQITGEINYTFPEGTRIPGGGFVVISGVVKELESATGISNVFGPWEGRLANEGGRVELLAERGAVRQTIQYRRGNEWPTSADGLGHSLTLRRPSFGEGDSRAWGPSRIRGGSPGAHEAFEVHSGMGLMINEIRPGDSVQSGFIEFHNASAGSIGLGGMRVGVDDLAGRFVIPQGTVLERGAVMQFSLTSLGVILGLDGGRVWLESSDGSRVVDAVRVQAMAPGWSFGRFPNGVGAFSSMNTPTPGQINARYLPELVFTEIHFNPVNGEVGLSFVEIFNRGQSEIPLSGWRLDVGIKFEFPPGAKIGPKQHIVVAKDAARLKAAHPELNVQAVFGDFSSQLSGRGERISLKPPADAFSDRATLLASLRNLGSEILYSDASRSSRWADGGGSSVELISPDLDPNIGAHWVDSNESHRSEWTTVEVTGVVEGGTQAGGGGRPGGGGAATAINGFQIQLMGEGECLIDNVEVLGDDGVNRLANGGFDSGSTGWTFSGNHIRTSWSSDAGESGGGLMLRASNNGDPGANKIYATMSSAFTVGQRATLRARVKWLRGWPEILLRIRGNYLEAYGRLKVPVGAGSPGKVNVATRTGRGPGIDSVDHFPPVPAASEPVVIRARIDDPEKVVSARVVYRLDPATTTSSLDLNDLGEAGDTISGDGIWSATLPPQPAGTLLAFRVEATSANASVGSSTFPPQSDGLNKECLIRYGEGSSSGMFGTYRLWLTQANTTAWINRPVLSNEPIDGTFVYGNSRVVYNSGARFAGSPYHQGFSGPTGDAHYVIEFPGGTRVLGATALNKVHAPGNGPFDDTTIQREQLVYWMARKMGMPYFHRRFVNVYINGSKRKTLMEDTQVGADDFAKQFWPNDSEGDMFKMQPWFEFGDGTARSLSFANAAWCYVIPHLRPDGSQNHRRYRWNWLVRGADTTSNSYSNVFDLVSIASSISTPADRARLEALVNIDEWFRFFAINHAAGNWDSVGYRNSQNTYSYKPRNGKWELIIWDANIVFGNSGSDQAATLPLFTTTDPTLTRWFATGSPLRRRFLTAYHALATGPMNTENYVEVLDSKYAQFVEHGVTAVDPAPIKTYVNAARNTILTQIGREAAPFSLTETNLDSPLIVLKGRGPLDMGGLLVNGKLIPVEWTSTSAWTAEFPSSLALNSLTVQSASLAGKAVDGTQVVIPVSGSSDRKLSIFRNNSGLEFNYPVLKAGSYTLQVSPNLSGASWTTHSKVDSAGGILILRLPMPTDNARFFRVLEP